MAWFRPAALLFLLSVASAGAAEERSMRIASIGGDVTEILYALGAGDRVIAVDRGSRHPADVRTKPQLGYKRQLSAEGLLALKPDLVIASDVAGPPETIDLLEESSIPFVLIPEPRSADGVVAKIRLVGATIGETERAEDYARIVQAELDAVLTEIASVPAGERKRVIYIHGVPSTGASAAGTDTAADALIRLCGAVNALGAMKGYRKVSDEAVIIAAPEVILMNDQAGKPVANEAIFDIPALKATPAVRDRALITMDGSYLLTFGPRTPAILRTIAHTLYPERVAAPPAD